MRVISQRIAVLLLSVILLGFLPACESETSYGKCVGYWQDDRRDPNLVYDLSMQNVLLGAIFFELMFIPPVLVLHHEMFCPVGKRDAAAGTPQTNALGETKRN